MEQAYALIQTKEFDEDGEVVRISGIASTPTPDRSRDIVDPLGAIFKTPMPLLWMHDHEKPVGHMTFAKPTKDGIPFTAEIPKVKEAGKLKDRIDEALHSLKYKLVAAVSIGFRPTEYAYMDDGGIHFKAWEWLELSLVTVPANPGAQIQLVKDLDRTALAALGIKRESRTPRKPGATGTRKAIQLIPRRNS